MPRRPEKPYIKVLIFTGFYLPGYKGGGPIKTIKNLVNQADQGVSYCLVTRDRDLGDRSPYKNITHNAWNQVGNAKVWYLPMGVVGLLQATRVLVQRDHDVVYLNSFFSVRFSLIPLLVNRALCQKVLLAPRGEFSSGALGLKPMRKRLFLMLYTFLGLHRGLVFQASNEYESEDIRKALGPNVDIQVAENVGAQDFAKNFEERTDGALRVVFVSRIVPMKNLLVALEVLKNVRQPVDYHIFGPIEDVEYWAKCEAAMSTLPSHVQIKYEGELNSDAVVKTMSRYDLFFMPTKGENYGHVMAEALCAGLPLLIADTTPWRDLQRKGIGWDLPLNNLDGFSAAIDELAGMPADEHKAMRETVLAWAKNKFAQRDAVENNIAMFRYACDKG